MRPRNLKFNLYINPYGYFLQKKIHVPQSHSFREKCDDILKNSKLHNVLINNFEILQVSIAFFSDTVWPRNLKFFCILTHMDTLCKPKIKFLCSTVFEKNAMITCKIQSCTIVLINNFEILQVSIAFFYNIVRPRNLKFFLYINLYGYSMQTKFHVPLSHSFREKCNDNLKLASHFSPILCDRGTWIFSKRLCDWWTQNFFV